MNKKLVRAKPMAHVRIFFKDLAHLLGPRPAVSRARGRRWLPILAAASRRAIAVAPGRAR